VSIADRQAHIREQLQATAALIKFCEDHGQSQGSRMDALRSCLSALEEGDIDEALRYHQMVPLGGNGTFNDWFPPVVFPHETNQYVATVFDALVTLWNLMMKLSIPKS